MLRRLVMKTSLNWIREATLVRYWATDDILLWLVSTALKWGSRVVHISAPVRIKSKVCELTVVAGHEGFRGDLKLQVFAESEVGCDHKIRRI